MTPNEAGEILKKQKWTFAKTMPHNPHYWSHFKSWDPIQLFYDMVRFLQLPERKTVKFGNRMYQVFDYEGWRYWSNGYAVSKTTILNRRVLNDVME